jgi:hypothetical protein
MNVRHDLWSQWSHDHHCLVKMAQRETTMPGLATIMAFMMPLTAGDRGTGSYTTGHPACLVVIVRFTTTYRLVVNHITTLSIIGLQVHRTVLIPITGMTLLPLLNVSLPP